MLRTLYVVLLVAAVLGLGAAPAAATPFFPYKTGLWLEFAFSDSSVPSNEWVSRLEFRDEVILGGKTYLHLAQWNLEPGSYFERYLRFTDDSLYEFEDGVELEHFRRGDVGTIWTSAVSDDPHATRIHEIVARSDVVVPYGAFSDAYVMRTYFEHDDGRPDSPFYFAIFVEGLGYVKDIDYYTKVPPPVIGELLAMGYAPLPGSLFLLGSSLLGLGAWRRLKRSYTD